MKVFSSQYFEDLVNEASQSYRLRAHANVHSSYADQCQKLFNAIQVDSYIQPHRHSLDPKEECLIAVKGLFGLILFTDQGLIRDVILFGSEKYSEKFLIPSGMELPPGVWHTVVSLMDDSVLFEVKGGPFDPGIAKELASWAPGGQSEGAPEYLETLRQKCLSELLKIQITIL
jgi:cupin fold WbuC family metalloprotein